METHALAPPADTGEARTTTRLALTAAAVAAAACLAAAAPQRAARTTPNAVVAADGSGQYRTVQAAIDAAPQSTSTAHPWVIFVRAGTYREVVYVQREKRFVMLIGEDPARTIITYDLHASTAGPDGRPIGTFRTPTVTIDADDFSVEDVTVQNDSGPVGQAVAVRVDGDRVVFRNCRFLGFQDTLLLNRGRQYVERSFIAGDVDFIFGGATAYFDRSLLYGWRNGYVTAASTPLGARYGFVFADGALTGASPEVRIYLGRPWRDFANVLFLRTHMSSAVRPAGWHNWDRPERERTAVFAEYGNTGPGADRRERVSWSRVLSGEDAAEASVSNVLGGGDHWSPERREPDPTKSAAGDPPFPPPPAR